MARPYAACEARLDRLGRGDPAARRRSLVTALSALETPPRLLQGLERIVAADRDRLLPWRREVDALLAGRPELEATGVLRRLRWEELAGASPQPPETGGPAPEAAADGVPAGVAPVLARLCWQPARPTRFVHTATELAEFATCPHRFYLTRRLGLSDGGDPWFDRGDEPDGTGEPDAAREPDGRDADAAELRPLDRGRLAHAVLDRVPLGLEGTWLAACVRELVRTHALQVPGGVPEGEQTEIADRIVTFLNGPVGRALGQAWRTGQDRVLREYPFILRLSDGGPVLLVRGAINVLWQDGDAWSLVDYKTTRRNGQETALKYEFQLLTYALAVTRLTRAFAGRTGIVFLLDEPAEPVRIDVSPARLAAFEARAVSVAKRIAELERGAQDSEAWPRITRLDCERLRCGFIARCYGLRRESRTAASCSVACRDLEFVPAPRMQTQLATRLRSRCSGASPKVTDGESRRSPPTS